jgi:hypothetical protein
MIGRDAPRPRNPPARRGRRAWRLWRLVRRQVRRASEERRDRRQRTVRGDVWRGPIETCQQGAVPERARKTARSRTACWKKSAKGERLPWSEPPQLAIGRPAGQALDICDREEGVRRVSSLQLRQVTQQGEDGPEVLEGLASPGPSLGLQGLPRRTFTGQGPAPPAGRQRSGSRELKLDCLGRRRVWRRFRLPRMMLGPCGPRGEVAERLKAAAC